MTFGEKLKAIRESRRMSQEQLADILDSSKQVISRYENGRNPNILVAKEFAEKLNIPIVNLVDDNIDVFSNTNLSENELDNQIIMVFNRLSEEKQRQALDYLAFLASQE